MAQSMPSRGSVRFSRTVKGTPKASPKPGAGSRPARTSSAFGANGGRAGQGKTNPRGSSGSRPGRSAGGAFGRNPGKAGGKVVMGQKRGFTPKWR